jgi:hypothetical protein
VSAEVTQAVPNSQRRGSSVIRTIVALILAAVAALWALPAGAAGVMPPPPAIVVTPSTTTTYGYDVASNGPGTPSVVVGSVATRAPAESPVDASTGGVSAAQAVFVAADSGTLTTAAGKSIDIPGDYVAGPSRSGGVLPQPIPYFGHIPIGLWVESGINGQYSIDNYMTCNRVPGAGSAEVCW